MDDWETITKNDIAVVKKEMLIHVNAEKTKQADSKKEYDEYIQLNKLHFDTEIKLMNNQYLRDRTDASIKDSKEGVQKLKDKRDKFLKDAKKEREEAKEKEERILKNIKKFYKNIMDDRAKLFLSNSTAEGLRMTIKSIMKMSEDLLSSNIISFLLTRKLNQDRLEVICCIDKLTFATVFYNILIYILAFFRMHTTSWRPK